MLSKHNQKSLRDFLVGFEFRVPCFELRSPNPQTTRNPKPETDQINSIYLIARTVILFTRYVSVAPLALLDIKPYWGTCQA